MSSDIVPTTSPTDDCKPLEGEVIIPEEPWINGFNATTNRESADASVFRCNIEFRANMAGFRKVAELLKELQKKYKLEGSDHMRGASMSAWESIDD